MANTYATDSAAYEASSEAAASTGLGGMLQALAKRFVLARQRRIDAEVGHFLEEHGGQLTDDLERQISRRFGTHSGQW